MRNKAESNRNQIVSMCFPHPLVMLIIIVVLNISRYRSNVELNSTRSFGMFYVGFLRLLLPNDCFRTSKIRDFLEN